MNKQKGRSGSHYCCYEKKRVIGEWDRRRCLRLSVGEIAAGLVSEKSQMEQRCCLWTWPW